MQCASIQCVCAVNWYCRNVDDVADADALVVNVNGFDKSCLLTVYSKHLCLQMGFNFKKRSAKQIYRIFHISHAFSKETQKQMALLEKNHDTQNVF